MTVKSPSPRYRQRFKDIQKSLLPIVIMFVVTFIYALGLRNETVRTIFLYMSLVFPVVMAISLSYTIPNLSYYQIDSAGVHMTIFGIIHKHIYWSDIESIGPVTIRSTEMIGVTYLDSFDRHTWARKSRRKMLGWDDILTNAYTENGASFSDDITRQFKKYLRTA